MSHYTQTQGKKTYFHGWWEAREGSCANTTLFSVRETSNFNMGDYYKFVFSFLKVWTDSILKLSYMFFIVTMTIKLH